MSECREWSRESWFSMLIMSDF